METADGAFRPAMRPPRAPLWSETRGLGAAGPLTQRWGERLDRQEETLEGAVLSLRLWARRLTGRVGLKRAVRRSVQRILVLSDGYRGRRPEELAELLAAMRPALRREGLGGPTSERAFAALRALVEAEIGLYPYDVQVAGGWALLMGLFVEMRTGEGKTLTAVQPAVTAALAGAPVHVITVNSYLAGRDAAFAEPIYARLGLSVGVVQDDTPYEARPELYRRDVVYAVNKQITFDYLRDRIAARGAGGVLEQSAQVLKRADAGEARGGTLRGLHYAIVDEADSVLIDEARTPLVVSRKEPNPELAALAAAALDIEDGLKETRDYWVDRKTRRVELTKEGRRRVRRAPVRDALLLRGRNRREAAAIMALYARHLLARGEHYEVADGKVTLVDEYTGRFMPDRSWSQGLQQIVELKEGLEPSDQMVTLGQITYQRFFRRYRAFAGMTGTAREVEAEVWRVYRLALFQTPPRHPSRILRSAPRFFLTEAEKWRAVAARADALRQAGMAVLVGTRTIAASRAASAALEALGARHAVLNAEHDADEADIVGRAGQVDADAALAKTPAKTPAETPAKTPAEMPAETAGAPPRPWGRITVATNMAGRGTDIMLHPDVRAAGGLAVLLTERHDSGRIDRQLYGRAARQDDPGRAETFLSLEDDLLQAATPRWLRRGLAVTLRTAPPLGRALCTLAFSAAQARLERANAAARAASVSEDRRVAKRLAFAGPQE